MTNDLSYDQRMARICCTLANEGYLVTLVGFRKKGSLPLSNVKYYQKRLYTFFRAGPGFYAESNIRLFFHLLFASADVYCCIDLDTIIPVWLAAVLRRKKRVIDAHEYFSQQKEVISRPAVHRKWKWIEKTFLPKFPRGYTVSESIAAAFSQTYGLHYDVIRNVPRLKPLPAFRKTSPPTILYQGAVNEARGLEFLVPAMKNIDAVLVICGDGNFMKQVKELVRVNNLEKKVFLKGNLVPDRLDLIAAEACMGLNLVENSGLNQYYSLANKFFDYIQAGLPQVTMNFPEYSKINKEFQVAVLINDLRQETIAGALNTLLNDEALYNSLRNNCIRAREVLNWQKEEKVLSAFYNALFEGEVN